MPQARLLVWQSLPAKEVTGILPSVPTALSIFFLSLKLHNGCCATRVSELALDLPIRALSGEVARRPATANPSPMITRSSRTFGFTLAPLITWHIRDTLLVQRFSLGQGHWQFRLP